MQAIKAVTVENFGGKFWKHPGNYLYAREVHLVPVVAGELSKVAANFPLAFAYASNRLQMMAVMSLQPQTNLLVGPEGQWMADYVPAYLRAHPFGLMKAEQSDELELAAFDEGDHLVAEGAGEPFFDAKGKYSPATQRVASFMQSLATGRAQIQKAVDALLAAGVIAPWELALNHNGQMHKIEGLFRLDEVAFDALKAGAMTTLRTEGAVGVAYAQLFSREHFNTLQRAARMQEQLRIAPQPEV